MANLSYIPSFYFYRFADAVSGPYTALNAYSSGIIDRNGNIKGNESSIDPFEYFVIKLKRIFDQLPPGTTKYKLQNLMGTLQVFNEEFDLPEISKEQLNSLIESHIMINAEDGVSYLNLLEDMSTGSAGGGAGTIGTPAEAPGANKGNVSGYDPVMMPMMSRSGPVNMFPSIEMFNVSKSEFDAFKAAKAWKQLQDSKTKKYLQRFQRRNKNGKMAVRDEESGEIFFIPYNEKSLVEQFNIEGLDILKESSLIEPETTETGRTSKSEVWALEHIKKIFDKNGFTHIPWDEQITDPLQYKISPGHRGREDIIASNSNGETVPVEAKSIKNGSNYRSFNIDLSTQKTPRGIATYGSVAHGLADIYDPEYETHQDKILRERPIEAVASELEKQKGIKFQTTQIPGIRWKALRDLGIPRFGTPEKARARVMNWRKGLLDMVGNEKGGAVLAINPEQRHLHVLNLDTGEKAGAVSKLLADLGGLRPTGTASTSNVGSAMFTPDPKMAKGSRGRRMLRVDYRFKPGGEKQDPWVENGNNALGGFSIGNREDFKDWAEILNRMVRGD